MKINVITQDPELLQALVPSLAPGSILSLPNGVTLKYDVTLSLRGFSAEPYTAQIVKFVLDHIDPIATGIVSTWLYDKLKGRRAELHIGDDDDVMISPEGIRQALMKMDK